jgi:hypothetical protein
VPWGRVSEAELRREVAADFREDLPPERLAAVELSLKAFGLIPESMELATYVPELLTSQIAGFYDPHRKMLAVVDRPGGLLGKDAVARFGTEVAHKMEDGLLVHELTHAIQDQHFDLDRLSDPDPLSDSGVARLALVEGDASLVMFDDLVQEPIEELPEARKMVGELLGTAGGEDGAAAGGCPAKRRWRTRRPGSATSCCSATRGAPPSVSRCARRGGRSCSTMPSPSTRRAPRSRSCTRRSGMAGATTR